MWRLSKLTLLVLTFLMALFGGLTLSDVDWVAIEAENNLIRELQLPLIFLVLSFSFMIPYVKRIKADRMQNK